jgi:hypothetical protein
LLQSFGHIDILVSNAAANPSVDSILEMKESVLDKLWDINVKASILLIQVSKFFHLLNSLYQQSWHHSLFTTKCFSGCCSSPTEGVICDYYFFNCWLQSRTRIDNVWCHKDCSLWSHEGICLCFFLSFFTLFAVTDQCQIILLLFTCID